MRLDHLLSKEKEEVGVALLSSCQGAALRVKNESRFVCLQTNLGEFLRRNGANGRARGARRVPRVGRTQSSDVEQQHFSGGVCTKRIAVGETYNLIFPVAMRLGDTPVLIPNTMVKT